MSDVGERVANLEARFDAVGQDLVEIRESVRRLDDRMEARFQQVDARFLQVDGRFQQVDARFQQVDARFGMLEKRMTDGFRVLRADMHTNFRWMMGGIAGAILTVVLSTLAQLFTP